MSLTDPKGNAHFQTNLCDSAWAGLGHILIFRTGYWGQFCVNQVEWESGGGEEVEVPQKRGRFCYQKRFQKIKNRRWALAP